MYKDGQLIAYKTVSVQSGLQGPKGDHNFPDPDRLRRDEA